MMARKQQEGDEGIQPLLLATLMARKEEQEGISPVVLAALMARKQEWEKQTV
jgi:hypothetical protein